MKNYFVEVLDQKLDERIFIEVIAKNEYFAISEALERLNKEYLIGSRQLKFLHVMEVEKFATKSDTDLLKAILQKLGKIENAILEQSFE